MILKIIYRGDVKSVNHSYQFNSKYKSYYMKKDVKDYKSELTNCAIKAIYESGNKKLFPIKKDIPLYLIVIYHYNDNRSCLDIDNIIKAILDALAKDKKKNKIVFENDKQFVGSTVCREKVDVKGFDIYVINNKIEYFNTRVELGV